MTEQPLALYPDPEGADVRLAASLLEASGFRVAVDDLRSESALIQRVRATQPAALLVTYLPVTEQVLDAAPSIRIVSCSSVGFEGVDLRAANRRGVWVCNVPDAATEEVATHALAMALSLVRHLPFFDRHVRNGGWSYEATGPLQRPTEMTLGIVGMGRIGRCLASLAAGLFDQVIGYDPVLGEEQWPSGVLRTHLKACLGQSHVVSLHPPLNSQPKGLIDRGALASMQHGAYLVNVSRGGLIDTEALLAELDSGRLAGAALDVTEPEPPATDSPVRRHPRILVTPHAAFYSARALATYIQRQAENVVAWRCDGRPNTPVNDPRARVS